MTQSPQTFTQHLEELRQRILGSLTAVGLLSLCTYFFSDSILFFLMHPLIKEGETLYFLSPSDAFFVKCQAALLGGLFLASPYLLHQIASFVMPGLSLKERRLAIPLTAIMTLLFFIGALFAYAIVMPLALRFLLGFQTEFMKPTITVGNYLGFVSTFVLGFGAAFNLPVLIVGMVSSGVVSVQRLKKLRRMNILILFILSSVLTPPDVISQLLLALPLILLYEVGLCVAELFKRRGDKKQDTHEEHNTP